MKFKVNYKDQTMIPMTSYKVAIRNNETNEIRSYTDPIEWDYDYIWSWTEGNFGCDCNREIFFNRAAGKEIDMSETKCTEGRFTVLYVELPDNTRILID